MPGENEPILSRYCRIGLMNDVHVVSGVLGTEQAELKISRRRSVLTLLSTIKGGLSIHPLARSVCWIYNATLSVLF